MRASLIYEAFMRFASSMVVILTNQRAALIYLSTKRLRLSLISLELMGFPWLNSLPPNPPLLFLLTIRLLSLLRKELNLLLATSLLNNLSLKLLLTSLPLLFLTYVLSAPFCPLQKSLFGIELAIPTPLDPKDIIFVNSFGIIQELNSSLLLIPLMIWKKQVVTMTTY